MTNAVLWMTYAKTCKAALDTALSMNQLLKKKVINLDINVKTNEVEIRYLRNFISSDDSIIKQRDKTVLKQEKTIKRQSTFMKVFFPILGGMVVGGVTYAIVK